MGFLALVPAIMALINKIVPDRAAADAAKLELMKIIEENKFKEFELQIEDTSSAREMVSNAAASGTKAGTGIAFSAMVLGWLTAVCFFGLLFSLGHLSIPIAFHDVYMVLIGTVASGFTQVLGFYLGSSSSSKSKDIALISALQNAASQSTEFNKDKTFKIKD